MLNKLRGAVIDFTGLFLFGLAMCLFSYKETIQLMFQLPASIYKMNTIFFSILIEAFPFVLLGVIISGLIQIFITEDHIKRWIPKNKYLAITMGCLLGAVFPGCECGIVPIIRRLLNKGVPIYAATGFMLTGPLINPLVIISTYIAFGNDLKIAFLRMGLGFIIALIIAIVMSLSIKMKPLRSSTHKKIKRDHHDFKASLLTKISGAMIHATDEFFYMVKYLILGILFAAFVQTYISYETLFSLGEGEAVATGLMMVLAYLLSVCSEADAFIAASFSNLFPISALLGFLIYGPMIDLKNTLMLLSVFKTKFVAVFFVVVTVIVFSVVLLFQGFYHR
ncbi:permease [Amphibacillus cookii]|uniref:permease n=1 Tax=Amphibacillus cookii TaxID=767787 RepID=UPI00195B9A76|nr:permease [Amphibacillus cookii]MBM7542982.1 uncharacterized membrane protein YraQ (UPF0718 family) [Amphibacillus cookii]